MAPGEIITGYANAFGVAETDSRSAVTGLLHRWQGRGYIDGVELVPAAEIDFATALARLLSSPALRGSFADSPQATAERLAVRDEERDAFISLDPDQLEHQVQALTAKKKKYRHRKPEAGNASTASYIRRLQSHVWATPSRSRHYRLSTTLLRLRFSTPEQEQCVHPTLAHLEADGPAEADVTLDIIEERNGHVIVRDGVPIGLSGALNQLAREVLLLVRDITINRTSFFLQIHAGVVSHGEQSVLLPAAPGGGKSTLVAALAHHGFRYLTDEIALLEDETLHVRPVPFAITIKPGSVAPLSAYYPELSEAPLHRREDEQDVLYLVPPAQDRWPADGSPAPVRWIVFPRYAPGETTVLRPLGKAEALARLLGECLVVPKDLDRAGVANLVAWMRKVACFELPFSSLPDAAELLRNLCAEDRAAG